MWILNLPNDIIGEILCYCDQFDLHNLLLINKTFYNHPILHHELTELQNWCNSRAEILNVVDPSCIYVDENDHIEYINHVNFATYITKLKTGDILGKIEDIGNIRTYAYNKYKNTYTACRSIYEREIKHNLYYYPDPYYNINSPADIILRAANLRINIVIKCKSSKYMDTLLVPRNNYHFALY